MMKPSLPRVNLKAFEIVWNEHSCKVKQLTSQMEEEGQRWRLQSSFTGAALLEGIGERSRKWSQKVAGTSQGSDWSLSGSGSLQIPWHRGSDQYSMANSLFCNNCKTDLLFTFCHVWWRIHKSMAQPHTRHFYPPRWTVFQCSTHPTHMEANSPGRIF